MINREPIWSKDHIESGFDQASLFDILSGDRYEQDIGAVARAVENERKVRNISKNAKITAEEIQDTSEFKVFQKKVIDENPSSGIKGIGVIIFALTLASLLALRALTWEAEDYNKISKKK